jgi:hypothetical protein
MTVSICPPFGAAITGSFWNRSRAFALDEASQILADADVFANQALEPVVLVAGVEMAAYNHRAVGTLD